MQRQCLGMVSMSHRVTNTAVGKHGVLFEHTTMLMQHVACLVPCILSPSNLKPAFRDRMVARPLDPDDFPSHVAVTVSRPGLGHPIPKSPRSFYEVQ